MAAIARVREKEGKSGEIDKDKRHFILKLGLFDAFWTEEHVIFSFGGAIYVNNLTVQMLKREGRPLAQ